jgi:hypothetical protein
MRILEAQIAAQEVFNALTSNEPKRAYVQQLAKLYTGEGRKPSDAANALLVYGSLSSRWYDPRDPNTIKALQTGLKAIFGIQLKNGNTRIPEQDFIDSLGRLIVTEFAPG